MKENREFDMLENADDKEVELLAEVPVLTKNEKERMLKMSKDKMNRVNRENNIEEQVSGVERYSRPKWYRFASVAACAALICGITGTAVFMHRHGQAPDIDPMSDITEPVTVPTTETATEVIDVGFDSAETLKQLFDKINELNVICSGGGVEVDEGNTVAFQYLEDNDNANAGTNKYHLVTDSRFSTVDEAWAYFGEYVAQPLITSEFYTYFNDDFAPAIFKEYDGKLYFLTKPDGPERATNIQLSEDDTGTIPVDLWLDDSDEANVLYSFSVPATVNGHSSILRGKMVRVDGKIKLSEYSIEFLDTEDKSGTSEEDTAANELLSRLEEFDYVCSGAGVKGDTQDIKEIRLGDEYAARYYRVTDDRFASIAEVKSYFAQSFTDSFLSGYSFLWDGDLPMFTEIDGSLYFIEGGKGGRFNFAGNRVVTEAVDDSFRIEIDNTLPGGYTERLQINCVKDDGRWNIDSFVSSEDGNAQTGEEYVSYQQLAENAVKAFYEIEGIIYRTPFEYDSEDAIVLRKMGCSVTYVPVLCDGKYSSVDDILSYIRANTCENLLADYESAMYIDGVDRFVDEDGKLYTVQMEGAVNNLGPTSSIEPVVKDENSFTVVVTETDGKSFELDVKKVGDDWKISDYHSKQGRFLPKS